MELVPVVTLPAGESLAGEAAARDLLAQLAQLGCDGHLGATASTRAPARSAVGREGSGCSTSSVPCTYRRSPCGPLLR